VSFVALHGARVRAMTEQIQSEKRKISNVWENLGFFFSPGFLPWKKGWLSLRRLILGFGVLDQIWELEPMGTLGKGEKIRGSMPLIPFLSEESKTSETGKVGRGGG